MLVFRINDYNTNEQIRNLENCVACFRGRSLWELFRDPLSRRGNYVLTLAVIKKIVKSVMRIILFIMCESVWVTKNMNYIVNRRYKIFHY